MIEQIIAVDWSGAESTAAQKESIWYCRVAASGQDIELDYGLSRDELFGWLLQWKFKAARMLIGLDFAFSFPAWFVREHFAASVPDMWRAAAEGAGEEWLKQGKYPFLGKHKGASGHDLRKKPGTAFRRTDCEIEGRKPKSPFQIGGSGHVGTGSIRGMRILYDLTQSGFSIWPFQDGGAYSVAEIYPRYFTGPVNKSSSLERREHLAKLRAEHPAYTRLTERQLAAAEFNDNAFDALISGIELWRRRDAAEVLPQATDEVTLLEGAIFAPAVVVS